MIFYFFVIWAFISFIVLSRYIFYHTAIFYARQDDSQSTTIKHQTSTFITAEGGGTLQLTATGQIAEFATTSELIAAGLIEII